MPAIPATCQPIANQVKTLENEVRALQEELKEAPPNQKAAIIAQIKRVNAEIGKTNQQLDACIRANVPAVVGKTTFELSKHGFCFVNSFEVDRSAVGIPGTGKFQMGLCGGMCFGALARFREKRPMPTTTTPPPPMGAGSDLFWELAARQVRTLLPFNWLKVLAWQAGTKKQEQVITIPLVPGGVGSMLIKTGVLDDEINVLTVAEEWPKVKNSIDNGEPAILILIRVQGLEADPTENHQVLAIGYSWLEQSSQITIDVYDPNVPGAISQLRLPEFTETTGGSAPASKSFRGFFVATVEG